MMAMSGAEQSGTFALGDRLVRRLGFGAMQLSGPNVFGPPKDRAAALAVLREAVASGVIERTKITSRREKDRLSLFRALDTCAVL